MNADDGARVEIEIRLPCVLCKTVARLHPLPFELNVCGKCLTTLEKPILLDGVVTSTNMRHLLESNAIEFNQRTESLVRKCRDIIEESQVER